MTRFMKVPKYRKQMTRFQVPNTETAGTKKVQNPNSVHLLTIIGVSGRASFFANFRPLPRIFVKFATNTAMHICYNAVTEAPVVRSVARPSSDWNWTRNRQIAGDGTSASDHSATRPPSSDHFFFLFDCLWFPSLRSLVHEKCYVCNWKFMDYL